MSYDEAQAGAALPGYCCDLINAIKALKTLAWSSRNAYAMSLTHAGQPFCAAPTQSISRDDSCT